MIFEKDYWFHHRDKGYFRVRVTLVDVLLELRPDEFVSVKDLFPTRKGFMDARSDRVRDVIMKAHVNEYNEMLCRLNSFTLVDEQDEYVVGEMLKEGYEVAVR